MALANFAFDYPPLRPSHGSNFAPRPHKSIVYIGARRATNGETRFILLTAQAIPHPLSQLSDVGFMLIDRPMGLANPKSDQIEPVFVSSLGSLGSVPRPKADILIYSATEDPADPSHFSFAYDNNFYHYIIDCRLQPDGTLNISAHDQAWESR
jgi:hypothetical protein